jgi:hypothetical protein
MTIKIVGKTGKLHARSLALRLRRPQLKLGVYLKKRRASG